LITRLLGLVVADTRVSRYFAAQFQPEEPVDPDDI
jgi:hypothetical protein